jgi:branched-chain amino acid transport system permease protein
LNYVFDHWIQFGITYLVLLGTQWIFVFSGQLILSVGALFAVGAYAAGILFNHFNELSISLLGGLFCGTLLGCLLGLLIFRLSNLYFSLSTLGFAYLVPSLIRRSDSFSGGSNGLSFAAKPDFSFFVLVLLILGFCSWLHWRIHRMSLSMALKLSRQHPLILQLTGLSLKKGRYLFFVLGSSLIGLAGALSAMNSGILSPDSFTLLFSLMFIVALIIGGANSPLGPFIGATFCYWVPHWTQDLNPGFSWALFGLTLILILRLAPHGLAELKIRKFIFPKVKKVL